MPSGFISVKLPRTNLDIDELFAQRRVAVQKKGGTLTAGGAYLWDLALLLEGCAGEIEGQVNWNDHSNVVVRMSKNLSYALRHSAEMRYDSECFVRMSELMNVKNSIVNSLLNPAKFIFAIFCQSEATLSSIFASLPREWYKPQAICHARHWHSSG